MKTWMMTAPRTRLIDSKARWYEEWDTIKVENIISKRELRILKLKSDVKKYTIAKETGEGGYEHWQARFDSSDPDLFERWTGIEPGLHLEPASTECDDYERKGGRYWSSSDTVEIRQCRFGEPRGWQKELIAEIKKQSVREIDVILDPDGNKGKSWLSIHLWEQKQAMVVPRYSCTSEKLSAYICSAHDGEPIVIIDIPRSNKPKKDLYETMEEVKDGLVFDPRYRGRCKNIRGCKVVVFTNEKLDLKALSSDRWILHGVTPDGEHLTNKRGTSYRNTKRGSPL